MSFHLPSAEASLRNYLKAFLVLLLVFLVGNILVAGVSMIAGVSLTDPGENTNLSLVFALFLLPFALLGVMFIFISKSMLKSTFIQMITSRINIDFKRLIVGFLLWFFLCLASFLFTKNDLVVNNFQFGKFALLLILALCLLPFQCLAEELFFRSFLLKWIGFKLPIKTAQVFITGIIFGYLHAFNPEVDAIGKSALLYYIGTGIFLGIVAVIDRGIELTTGFHLANNLFAAIVVSNSWQVFQTDAIFIDHNEPNFTITDFVLTFGGQLLFFIFCWAIFWRKRKVDIKG